MPEFLSSQYSTITRKWIGIKDIELISEVVFVSEPGIWTPKGTYFCHTPAVVTDYLPMDSVDVCTRGECFAAYPCVSTDMRIASNLNKA